MKYLYLLITSLTILSSSLSAQISDADIDNLQTKFATAKREIVVEYIPLCEERQGEFWELYDEYDLKRKEIGKNRVEVVFNYLNNNLAMADNDLDKEVLKFIKVKNKTNKLLEKYYKKINKSCGGKVASKFYVIEVYFQDKVREQFREQIPFMVEVDNKYKDK